MELIYITSKTYIHKNKEEKREREKKKVYFNVCLFVCQVKCFILNLLIDFILFASEETNYCYFVQIVVKYNVVI